MFIVVSVCFIKLAGTSLKSCGVVFRSTFIAVWQERLDYRLHLSTLPRYSICVYAHVYVQVQTVGYGYVDLESHPMYVCSSV